MSKKKQNSNCTFSVIKTNLNIFMIIEVFYLHHQAGEQDEEKSDVRVLLQVLSELDEYRKINLPRSGAISQLSLCK